MKSKKIGKCGHAYQREKKSEKRFQKLSVWQTQWHALGILQTNKMCCYSLKCRIRDRQSTSEYKNEYMSTICVWCQNQRKASKSRNIKSNAVYSEAH